MKRIKNKKDRLGETVITNEGYLVKIIEYISWDNITVQFEDGNVIKNMQYTQFKNGQIKNRMKRSVFGVGYMGFGEYERKKSGLKRYNTWQGMLRRAYDKKFLKRNPSYVGCTVCEEWHNYQNFAKWYDENYYEVENQNMELDKDILVKGNKTYSPETCMFIPSRINSLFTSSRANRGELPIGVFKRKEDGKYNTYCRVDGKCQIYIGSSDTTLGAFKIYKEFKENYAKELADELKDKIPNSVYNAIINYRIEIWD